MKVSFLFFLVGLFFGGVSSYDCKRCLGDMCCNIPSDHTYYLTDFCGGYPHSQTSCGEYCDQYKWFTADRQRFGCNSYLHICGRGKCVNAKVIDAGPAYWVEQDAGKAIIDASPAVCSYISGHSSCGWSDRILITAVPTSSITDDQLGPFNVTEEEYNRIINMASSYNFEPATCPEKEKALINEKDTSLAQSATSPKVPCCSPSQWEGYQFGWDPKHHWRGGFNISYDWTNKRVRILVEERHAHSPKRRLESIALYGQQKLFLINHDNGSCVVETLTSSMPQDCIPSTAKHEASITIGGTLEADVWSFKVNDPALGEVEYVEVRSSDSCIPVDVAAHDHKLGVEINGFWDITAGIKNPNVFTPPSNCKPALEGTNEMYSLVKAMTLAVGRS